MNRHKDRKKKIAVVEMFKAVCACNYYQNKWIPDFLWFHIIMQEFDLMEDEATHIGLTNLNRILSLPCFSDVVHPDEGRYSTNGIFKCERWVGKKKHNFYCAVTEEFIPMPSHTRLTTHTRLTKRRRVIDTTPRITRGRSKASLVSPDEGGNSQTKMPLLGKDIFSRYGSMRIGRKRLAAAIKNKVDVSFVQPGIQEWLHSERGLEYLRLYSSERQRALEADILMLDDESKNDEVAGVSVTRPQHEDTSNCLHLFLLTMVLTSPILFL